MATDHSEDEIVRLARAANPVEAHIWEEALLAEGIRCKVVGDLLDAGLGDVPGVSPEVWVHRKDLARAEEVLRRGQGLSHDEETEDEAQS
jgi:hypothetical protein